MDFRSSYVQCQKLTIWILYASLPYFFVYTTLKLAHYISPLLKKKANQLLFKYDIEAIFDYIMFFLSFIKAYPVLDYEQSLFFPVVRRTKRETCKWPRAWLMARYGRGTKKERLPAKPERMVFHGLVSFWRQNWSVDRPGTWNVTFIEFAWTAEVFLLFFLKCSLCSA